ncbi:MAG TPA: hypothetical protein VF600_14325 [Abditibacteriaceae bacterium]|jgi:hypothetical protein
MKSAISSRRVWLLGGVALIGTAAQAQKTAVPADMLGSWRWTTISGTNYVDKNTGQITDNAGGMSVGFVFNRNGRYKFNFFVRQKTYSLVTEAYSTHEGTVKFGDGQFILIAEKGHYRGSSTGGKTVDRPMTKDELKKNTVYLYKWETVDGKRQLKIGPTLNSLSLFKRV